jgi:hypothetical protein
VKQRWIVFGVALAVRCVVAFFFLGTVDVTNAIGDAEDLIGGLRPSAIEAPYLPGVQLPIWTAGILGFHSVLPFSFLFKFPGCLFDAVIAAIIADVRGRRVGLLYAFAPVPILIFGIHGQWDSLSLAPFILGMLLLRREGKGAAAGAGALAVLSVVAKPITVPFLVFFVERRRIVPLIAGGVAALAVYLGVMWTIGDPLSLGTLDRIMQYASGGVTYLGLPFGLGIPANRLLMLVPLLVLVPLYATGRIAREEAVTIAYAFVLGTSGLSAQYLAWLLPFLLLRGYERFAALYGLLAGAYLAVFYGSIGHDGVNWMNMIAFAAWRPAAWLTPAVSHVLAKVYVVVALGHYQVPIACLVFAILQCRAGFRPSGRAEARPAFSTVPLAVAFIVILGLFVAALQLPRPAKEAFHQRAEERIREYTVTKVIRPQAGWLIEFQKPKAIDALTIAYAWIAAWTVIAARGAIARDR